MWWWYWICYKNIYDAQSRAAVLYKWSQNKILYFVWRWLLFVTSLKLCYTYRDKERKYHALLCNPSREFTINSKKKKKKITVPGDLIQE